MSVLNEQDYEILIAIRDGDGFVNEFDVARVKRLHSDGYIVHRDDAFERAHFDNKDFMVGLYPYKLTPKGEDAITSFEEQTQNRANEKERRNLDELEKNKTTGKETFRFWFRIGWDLFIAIAAAAVGAFFEYKTAFLENIFGFFQ